MNEWEKMDEELFEFKATIILSLNGKNTRVTRDEIYAIGDVAIQKAKEFCIDAEISSFDR